MHEANKTYSFQGVNSFKHEIFTTGKALGYSRKHDVSSTNYSRCLLEDGVIYFPFDSIATGTS